jgi:hypothetical protein
MAQIQFFENISNASLDWGTNSASGQLKMQAIYVPHSISMKTLGWAAGAAAATAKTAWLSFGLYSLNGVTLSLANSASGSATYTGAGSSYWTATMSNSSFNMTPGIWFFAHLSSSSSDSRVSLLMNSGSNANHTNSYGGPFFRGWYSATTTQLPASINTSAMVKEGWGAVSDMQHPYILISGA